MACVITAEALGRAMGEAPNPELARVAISRLGEVPAVRALLERPDILGPAARLLGFSSAAADFFLAHPREMESLAHIRLRSLGDLTAEVGADVAALGPGAGIRRFRRRATYRIAARDLSGGAVEEVMAELSDVAEACLRAATDASGADLAVIGMGKLGGRELNYSSDVDVLFLHADVGAEAQEAASRGAAGVIELLSESTEEGVALRVDVSLRPEGRAGPLSRSIDSMLEYYGRFAKTWERQALLKARPVAGDMDLGRIFIDEVADHVYPAVLPAAVVEEVRGTKARVEEHVRALGKEAVEVKRGRGGIRDVEFAVQLLQLVHGRGHRRLRHTGTLAALQAMAEQGLVGPEDALSLAHSYRFLRRLEHRLQMVRDQRTHELPRDPASLGPLARSVGLAGADRLRAEYLRHTDNVRTLHERLFYRPLLEAVASSPAPRAGEDRQAAEEVLLGLGFADPRRAYDTFVSLVQPTTRLGKVLDLLFPVVAPALAFAAVPDAALLRFARVAEAIRGDDGLAAGLGERPDAARRLAVLVAVSSAFSDMLVNRPSLVTALYEPSSPDVPLFHEDAQAELVRVAGAHAAGDLRVPDTGRRLAMLADGVVARAMAEQQLPFPMAVIGLGRLGAEELTFASDLDLMFVYEGEGAGTFEVAGRAAERVLEAIREQGWQPDVDVRPEGRSGPLARSIGSYLEYWQGWAETWERQTLLRARLVGGDETLGRRFMMNAADVAYGPSVTFEQVAAIRRMRVRMEEERVRPRDARRLHFKLGYGSLADVQFAVELELMRHGGDHPSIRRTNTLEAIDALEAEGLIEEEVARSLSEAYVFLLTVKAALELERLVPSGALPPAPEDQAALARRLGYEERARQSFLDDYRRLTRLARMAMERIFYGESEPR
jgi:[glutamine synthetase] adenylyltransferase / [glutamine synthetase]-adenylyl-L-tyrosine phosphorylase